MVDDTTGNERCTRKQPSAIDDGRIKASFLFFCFCKTTSS